MHNVTHIFKLENYNQISVKILFLMCMQSLKTLTSNFGDCILLDVSEKKSFTPPPLPRAYTPIFKEIKNIHEKKYHITLKTNIQILVIPTYTYTCVQNRTVHVTCNFPSAEGFCMVSNKNCIILGSRGRISAPGH